MSNLLCPPGHADDLRVVGHEARRHEIGAPHEGNADRDDEIEDGGELKAASESAWRHGVVPFRSAARGRADDGLGTTTKLGARGSTVAFQRCAALSGGREVAARSPDLRAAAVTTANRHLQHLQQIAETAELLGVGWLKAAAGVTDVD